MYLKVRRLLLCVTSAVALFTVVGCAKEGDISARHKINTVYEERTVYCDGTPYYTLPQEKVQQWHWDGNELYRIDYTEDDAVYSENIFYNRRGQINRTTVPAHKIETAIVYDGRFIDSILVSVSGRLYCTYAFTHDKKKITQIVKHTVGGGDATKMPSLLPDLMVESLLPTVVTGDGDPYAKSNGDIIYTLTWEGKNVSRMTLRDDNTTHTFTYTYDEAVNPYQECYTYYETNNIGSELLVVSRNNIKTLTTVFDGNTNYVFHYDYVYDGELPTSRTADYTYHAMNNQTWNDAEYRVVEKRSMTYL